MLQPALNPLKLGIELVKRGGSPQPGSVPNPAAEFLEIWPDTKIWLALRIGLSTDTNVKYLYLE
jgi:hypothetical protein